MSYIVRFFALSGCFLFLLTAPARADIYGYVDDNGVWHYTNVPADSRYRLVQREESAARPSLAVSGKRSLLQAPLDRIQPRKRKITVSGGDLERHIRRAAFEHQVDPHLIKAIIKAESNFDPYAVSPNGAQGLMQLMPGTARELAVVNPFDAAQNIWAGTRYFRKLLDAYHGDLALSLAAYNAGPGRVSRHGNIPRIPETRAYVRKVIDLYRSYQKGAVLSTSINVRRLVTVN
ncbi:lytic transglycosylase domain-containing protein [Desulfolithobacter sp.]